MDVWCEHQSLLHALRGLPDRSICLLTHGQRFTVSEVESAARALSLEISQRLLHCEHVPTRGINETGNVNSHHGAQKHVAIFLQGSVPYVVSILAVSAAGAAFVPLDPSWPLGRIQAIIADCTPELILTTKALLPVLQKATCSANRQDLQLTSGGVGTTDGKDESNGWRFEKGHTTIPSDEGGNPLLFVSFPPSSNQHTNQHSPRKTPQIQLSGLENDSHSNQLSHPVSSISSWPRYTYILYTSGSTGQPKGVCGTLPALLNRLRWMAEAYPYQPDDVCCFKTGIGFIDHLTELLGPILAGVPVVIPPANQMQDTPMALSDLVQKHRITRLVAVTSLLRILVASSDVSKKLATLRLVVSSGEALTWDLAERLQNALPQATILNLYGSTEVTGDVLCFNVTKYLSAGGMTSASSTVPIGRPILGHRAILINEDLEEQLAVGEVSELCVTGPCLCSGYLNRLEASAAAFIHRPINGEAACEPSDGVKSERWYRTGDLAKRLPDGNYVWVGRRDRQVKIRGQRVQLEEVEAAIRGCPTVRSAAVKSWALRGRDCALAAYVVLRGSDGADSTEEGPTSKQAVSLNDFSAASEPGVDTESKRSQPQRSETGKQTDTETEMETQPERVALIRNRNQRPLCSDGLPATGTVLGHSQSIASQERHPAVSLPGCRKSNGEERANPLDGLDRTATGAERGSVAPDFTDETNGAPTGGEWRSQGARSRPRAQLELVVEHVRGLLVAAAIPTWIEHVAGLPLTCSGKVDYAALAAPADLAHAQSGSATWLERGGLEIDPVGVGESDREPRFASGGIAAGSAAKGVLPAGMGREFCGGRDTGGGDGILAGGAETAARGVLPSHNRSGVSGKGGTRGGKETAAENRDEAGTSGAAKIGRDGRENARAAELVAAAVVPQLGAARKEWHGDYEQVLAAIQGAFGRVLGSCHVDHCTDFFTAGGSSVTAAELAFALGIDMRQVYECRTPEALTSVLLKRAGGVASGLLKGDAELTSAVIEGDARVASATLHLHGKMTSALTENVAEVQADVAAGFNSDVVLWDSDDGEIGRPMERGQREIERRPAAGFTEPGLQGLRSNPGGLDKSAKAPSLALDSESWERLVRAHGPFSLTRCNHLVPVADLRLGSESKAAKPETGSEIGIRNGKLSGSGNGNANLNQERDWGPETQSLALHPGTFSEHSFRMMKQYVLPWGPSPGRFSIQPAWRDQLGQCVDASPVLLAAREKASRVFIGSHAHVFMCLDASNGETIWKREVGGRVEATAGMTRDGGKVVVGCYDGKIYVFAADDGKLEWSFQTGGEVKCQAVADPWEGFIWCGSHDHHVYVLDVSNKRAVFQHDCGGSVYGTPAFDREQGRSYAVTTRGHVVAFDGRTFQVCWILNLSSPLFASPAVTPSGLLLCASVDGHVTALTSSGELTWRTQMGGPVFAGACLSPALPKQALICSRDGHVRGLYFESGRLLWDLEPSVKWVGEPITASAAVDETVAIYIIGSKPEIACGDFERTEAMNIEASDGSRGVEIGREEDKGKSPHTRVVRIPADGEHPGGIHSVHSKGAQEMGLGGGLYRLVWVCGSAGTVRAVAVRAQCEPAESEHTKRAIRTNTTVNVGRERACDDDICESRLSKRQHIDVEAASHLQTGTPVGNEVRVLAAMTLPGDVFSSPVAVGGCMFVGCRDDHVYALRLFAKPMLSV